jgi:hypothetical protein
LTAEREDAVEPNMRKLGGGMTAEDAEGTDGTEEGRNELSHEDILGSIEYDGL